MIERTDGPDGIVEIRCEAPAGKVNLITEEFLARLDALVSALEGDAAAGTARAVVFTSATPGVFLAGADVKAFVPVAETGDPDLVARKAREGQRVFSRLESLPIPTVAAINGVCLGGGLELALACSSRVAGDGEAVALGLPEVRLGLVPGWGGTQRLPRLIGPSRALGLILTGRSLSGRQAKKLGLVDRVAPAEGLDHAARDEARRLAGGETPRRPSRPWLDRTAVGRALVFALARRRTLAQTKGRFPAPPAAIEAVQFGLGRPLEEGLENEARLLGRLLVGDVSRNLVWLFLASRATGPAGSSGTTVSRLAVIGAGTMGGGIAAVAAMAGVPVRLRDVDASALARGMAQVRKRAVGAVKKGRLPRHEANRRELLVEASVDGAGFTRCDLVIEAVVEDLAVKQQVLREMERATSPRCIFATNTSSLSVAAIAEASSRPERVLGLHFFNPVEKMPLVEVVRGPATDDDAVAAAVGLARRMGKTPVVVKDTPGFIVNRILMPYLGGAMGMLAGGGTIGAIDGAMTRFGMPMGPFALLDRIGLDVAAKVADVLSSAFPDRAGDGRLLHGMMQAGLLGVKSGGGFYRYGRSGSRTGENPDAVRLASTLGGGQPPPDGEDAIAERLVGAMIEEAARLLDEKAVEGPEVIDLAMVFGAGFPPERGGLLRHADATGKGRFYS